MTLQRYEYYPASPQSIRSEAGRARDAAGDIQAVIQHVEREHRKAVDVTDGELAGTMRKSFIGPKSNASQVNRQALWAGAQLEAFADAIETYNQDSRDPMSIALLNQKVDLGAERYFCLVTPGSDADSTERFAFMHLMQQKEAELQGTLDAQLGRLEGNLDDAADDVAQALQREPTDADIIAAWKAGNLPEIAVLVWPELNLRSIPINGFDENLFGLTEQQIVDRLKDPTKALSAAELEWLAVNYPQVMQRFHDQWSLQNTALLPPDQPPAGHEGESSEQGWILGPDGQWYAVQVPQAPPPSTGPTIVGQPGSLYNSNGGWVTLDSRQGPIMAGDRPPAWLVIAGKASGAPLDIVGNLSVGQNQTDYLTYDQYGNVIAHQQADDHLPAWKPPPGYTWQPKNAAPPDTWDASQMDNPAKDRLDRASGVFNLGVGALQGVQLSNQIDADMSYAGNVSFQSSGDEHRAVIQLAQLQYDQDTGKVVSNPYRTYGVIDEDGEINHYYQPVH